MIKYPDKNEHQLQPLEAFSWMYPESTIVYIAISRTSTIKLFISAAAFSAEKRSSEVPFTAACAGNKSKFLYIGLWTCPVRNN